MNTVNPVAPNRQRDAADVPAAASQVQLSPPLELGAVLWRSLPGRVVLVATAVLALLVAAGAIVDLPAPLDLVRRVAWISWLIASAWLLAVALIRNRAALLWRVRRKLLLSYFFFGLVPVALIMAFVLAAAVLLYVTVASYVFRESYGDALMTARNIAEASAVESERTPALAASGLERRYANLRARFPGLSLAVVPVAGGSGPSAGTDAIVAGPWAHLAAPEVIPAWVADARGMDGTLVVVRGEGASAELVVRAAVSTTDGRQMAVVDIPVSGALLASTRSETGVAMESFSATGCGVDVAATVPDDEWALFRRTVTFVDCTVWTSGETGRLSFNLLAPVTDLYDRLSALQSAAVGASQTDWGRVLLQLLWLLGGLFLVVQASAIVMGVLLARSITSAIHELFEGTERIRIGDFAHRIHIASKDQLGKLAESFNGMSESIERLLHVEREKQRLDDELRIARQIQMSLLPVQPPTMAGLDVADLCEPARAVGGDYYDFFDLGDDRLGVLVADVAGKGTSAALYMAELKGIMVALSRADPSPGAVLRRVNQLLVGQLDNRSFITMSYAVIDVRRGAVTIARAGHSPMIAVSAGRADVVAPDGMVLGLRLPGAEDLFERVLEEREVPIANGDILVFYTDGVTEAMAPDGEMFGDERLARLAVGSEHLSAAGIRERVVRDIRAFTGPGDAHDDMTMVIVKVGGGSV